jgi:hypothetical protein
MRPCYHLDMIPKVVHEYFKALGKKGGRKGGRAGGKARAAKLSPERRSAIAKAAITARWETYRQRRDLEW